MHFSSFLAATITLTTGYSLKEEALLRGKNKPRRKTTKGYANMGSRIMPIQTQNVVSRTAVRMLLLPQYIYAELIANPLLYRNMDMLCLEE